MISSANQGASPGPRIGLAMAGGGPEGAVFEIGALRALDEGLDGLDLTRLEIYVGVSAGSFLAACLANGLTTAQLCRAIVKQQAGEHPFMPETFFTPAVGEFVKRGFQVPGLVLESFRDYLLRPRDMTLLESFGRLARALPVGMFDNEPIRLYLKHIFGLKDRTDDFRKLDRPLIVVAADLDSGKAVRFGEPGLDHVPISRAVQASSAVPGVYPPVVIEGRHYVDGALLKTLHASVALDAGVDLLLCINPIVPVDTSDAVEAGAMRQGNLVSRGLPTVMSQTFRTLVRSRLAAGFASYDPLYPGQDVLLFEPRSDDYRMFFTNIFSFSSRKAICDHAYQVTRRLLLENRETWEPILARHGVRYRMENLLQRERTVWDAIGRPDGPPSLPVTDRLDEALARLEAMLEKKPSAPAAKEEDQGQQEEDRP